MLDVYDAAVAYLRKQPACDIYWSWRYGAYPTDDKHPAACLFRYVSVSGNNDNCDDTGCLTTIRAYNLRHAATPELTAAIRADSRIPCKPEDITPEDLPVFAEWQRRLDKELNREPPPITPELEPYLREEPVHG